MFLLFGLVAHAKLTDLTADTTDLPFYCRVFRNILLDQQTSFAKMVAEDVTVNHKVHVDLVGDVDTTMSHVKVGALGVEDCDVSVTDGGIVTIELTKMSMDLTEFQWSTAQESWPHLKDAGSAHAASTVSFKFAFNARTDEMEVSEFALNAIDIKILKADHAKWLMNALMEVMHLTRPILSLVMNRVVKKMMTQQLFTIRHDSGCALVEGMLPNADFTQVEFKTDEPLPFDVPVMGSIAGWKVGLDVTSTSISPPTSMKCKKVSFDGESLDIEISEFQTSIAFDWGYNKIGEGTWEPHFHNTGTADVDVTAGVVLKFNLVQPDKTKIDISLPQLKVKINADSDAWLYKAMTWALTPLVRVGMETLGAKVYQHELKKCLEDPQCPRPHHTAGDAALLETAREARRVVRSQE